jgi:hypothetical protein
VSAQLIRDYCSTVYFTTTSAVATATVP